MVRLLPLGMAVMVVVDEILGESAEYFSASELLRAWGSVLGGEGLGGHRFLIGQAHLGDATALATGSVVFVLEPAVVLAAIVVGGSVLGDAARRATGRA